jgi:hypothetical protein
MQKDGLLPLNQHALQVIDDVAYHDYEGTVLRRVAQGWHLAMGHGVVSVLGKKRSYYICRHVNRWTMIGGETSPAALGQRPHPLSPNNPRVDPRNSCICKSAEGSRFFLASLSGSGSQEIRGRERQAVGGAAQ